MNFSADKSLRMFAQNLDMREITRKLKRDFLILSAKINPSESFRKSLLFFVILSFVSNAKYHVFIFAQGPQEVSNPRGHNSLSAATGNTGSKRLVLACFSKH